MTDNARARKLADRIQVVVAETLERRIKDPRLGFVTITDTRVTGDLREATVFYTVYGDDEERAASAAALESAKGVLRSEVGPADRGPVHADPGVRPGRPARTTPAPSRTCSTRRGPRTPRCARCRRARRTRATPTRTASRSDEDDEPDEARRGRHGSQHCAE